MMVPRDKLNIVFMIFFVNGIASLLPWNMLISADRYFVGYKLNVTDPSPALRNYRTSFLSYLGLASKLPNISLQILNLFYNSENSNLSLRISWTLCIQIWVFFFIIFLAILDSSSWPSLFFWLTMFSAAVINLANGVFQSCIYGLAGRFPMKYTNAITTGMNVSGTIASLLMILSLSMSPELEIEAIIFFSCAVAILIICLGGEYYIRKNDFFQFYAKNYFKEVITSINSCPACFEKNYPNNNNNDCPHLGMDIAKAITYDGKKSIASSSSSSSSSNSSKTSSSSKMDQYLEVFKQIYMLLLNIVLIYTVSFSLFPAVQARIKSKDHWLSENYFTQVFCFLSFNLFATIGNFAAQQFQWPGPRHLIIFSLLRLLFIPFFLFCNYYPDGEHRSLPVIFDRDWMFVIGSITHALSAGYLSSLCMMYAPKCVKPNLSTTAGMISALTIIIGILVGINLGLLYPPLVNI